MVAIETYTAQRVVAVEALAPDGSRIVGTGALIADGLVLTARHMVCDATELTVKFGLLPGSPKLSATIRWSGKGPFTDIAVLRLSGTTPDALVSARPVRLGRIARDARESYRVNCTALGYPDHARQRVGDTGQPYLNSFEVHAQIPLASAWRDGALHLGVDATTGSPGPWNGMSGAPVFAHGLLVAVVTRTAQAGANRNLQAVPLSLATGHDHPTVGASTKFDEPVGSSDQLRQLLAEAQLMIPDTDRVAAPLPFAHRVSMYTEEIRHLADSAAPVRERDEEMRELVRWCRSQGRRAVWAGESWVGKTTLASAFAAAPPPDVDIVSFFFSRTGARQRAEFWWAVTDQLAALLGMDTPQAPSGLAFASLWSQAATRGLRHGRELVLLIDGLDELAEERELLVHLPDGSLPRTHIVIFSRRLPDPSAWGSIAETCDVYELLGNSVSVASRQQAEAELSDLLATPASPTHGLLSLIALLGPLTVVDLQSLTEQAGPDHSLSRHQVTGLLTDVAVRSIVRREGEPGDAAFVFTHSELKDGFAAEMGEQARTHWKDVITRSAAHWAASGWPDETPGWITDQYTAYLADTGDSVAWNRLLDDDRWAALLLRRTGAELRLLLDSERRLRSLGRESVPSLKAIVNRGIRLESLRRPALSLPAAMAVAWADAGFPERAERIARERTPSPDRSWLFRRLGMAAHEHSKRRDALRLLDAAVKDATDHPPDDDADASLLHGCLADLARRVGGEGLRWAVLQQLHVTDQDIRMVEFANMPDGTPSRSPYAEFLYWPRGRPRYKLWSHAREAADRGDLVALPGMIYALDMEGALGIGNFEGAAQRDALADIVATAACKHPRHPSLVAVLEAAEERCVEAVSAHRAGDWCESEEAAQGLADVVAVLIKQGQWDDTALRLAENGTETVVERPAAKARLAACALGAALGGQLKMALWFLQEAGQGAVTVAARQALARHWAHEPGVWPTAIAVMETLNYGRYEEAELVADCLRTGFRCGMDDEAFELLVDYLQTHSPDEVSYAERVTHFVITAVRGCVQVDRDESARLLADSLLHADACALAWSAYAHECARRHLVSAAMDGMDRAERLCDEHNMTRKVTARVLCGLLRTSLRLNDEARTARLSDMVEDMARAASRLPPRLLAFLVRVHRKRTANSARAHELLRELETMAATEQDQHRRALLQLLVATLHAETDDLRTATQLAAHADSPVWAWATSYQPEVHRLARVTARGDTRLAGALYGRFTEQVARASGNSLWVGQHSKLHGRVLDLAAELDLWKEGTDFIERLPTDARAQYLGQLAAAAADRAPDQVPGLLAKGFGYGVAPSLLAAAGRADTTVAGTCFVAFIERMARARRH
ncbi:trypsin-like peptidase domain-containing protein [Streptomyces phaeochromogenes]|uniref:trypsin-like peptidase domain-containing protein n=1 Tax=Streptomyces phaeochromogenes TaxID=1923 RepID=UPI0036A1B06D